MTMRAFRDTVRSAIDGREIAANIFVCDCGSLHFGIFQVVGQDHLHFQCVDCHQTFCPKGEDCHKDMIEKKILEEN